MSSPSPAEIRAARDEAGLSQSQAAQIAMVSTRTWIKWESGEHPPSLPAWTLFRLRTGQVTPGEI